MAQISQHIHQSMVWWPDNGLYWLGSAEILEMYENVSFDISEDTRDQFMATIFGEDTEDDDDAQGEDSRYYTNLENAMEE